MAYAWAKVYIEILDDHKMGLLPDSLWRRVIELILLAKKNDRDGFLPGAIEMSWALRISVEQLEADLEKISKIGADSEPPRPILEIRDGEWYLVNFTKRQAAEPVTERVRNFRNRNTKRTGNDEETKSYQTKTKTKTRQDKTVGANDAPTPPDESASDDTRKGKTRKPKTPKLPRERDVLFDAIAEVCAIDPATAGASIGNVKAALLKADPPYKPDEVRSFGTWWNGNNWRKEKGPPSLWQLKEKIGIVRNGNGHNKPAALSVPVSPADVQAEFERLNPRKTKT